MKSVLIIQSYHPELAWTRQCEEGIRRALPPGTRVSIVYMDTKRLPKSKFPDRAELAWQRYLAEKPDLVMLGDDNALGLLGARFSTTRTPVVYFGINNNPRFYFPAGLPLNITGVLERLPIFPWLRHIKKTMPDAAKVLVLMDASFTSQAIMESAFSNRERIKFAGMELFCRIAGDWDDWRQTVRAGGVDMVLVPTFHAVKQKDGSHVANDEVIRWTSRHAGVPLFSYQDYTVGPEGAAGAYVVSGQSHGDLAGRMARSFLEGHPDRGRISPRTDWQGRFYFNRALLDRYGLVLPSDIEAQATFQ